MKNVNSIANQGLVRPKAAQHGAAGSKGKMVVYCSPSIEYSSHWVYTATRQELDAKSPGSPSRVAAVASGSSIEASLDLPVVCKDGSYAQYVFEVRVKPGSYRAQGNTLSDSLWESWGIEYDPVVSSRNLEWIVENEEDIVVTGVMLRALPKGMHPKEFNAQRLETMKAHVGWDETEKVATRPRGYCGVEPGAISAVAWEWNAAPAESDKFNGPLSYDDKWDWMRHPDEINEIIESAYLDYQRFAFIGRPEGAPGPYFIDFGSECEDTTWGWPRTCGHGPQQRRADSDQKQDWRMRAVRRVQQ